jgi:hypothetical protein
VANGQQLAQLHHAQHKLILRSKLHLDGRCADDLGWVGLGIGGRGTGKVGAGQGRAGPLMRGQPAAAALTSEAAGISAFPPGMLARVLLQSAQPSAAHLFKRQVPLAGRVHAWEQVVEEAHEDDHVLWEVCRRQVWGWTQPFKPILTFSGNKRVAKLPQGTHHREWLGDAVRSPHPQLQQAALKLGHKRSAGPQPRDSPAPGFWGC